MSTSLFRRVQLRELRPRAQNTPDNTVLIEAGVYTKSDGTGIVRIPSAVSSSTFPVVSGGGKTRYDLLCLDDTSASVIVSGTEVVSPGDPIADAPALPSDKLTIAIVRVNETATVIIDGSDITDVREFLNKGGGGAGNQGPQGWQGSAGPQGYQGWQGINGTTGTNGSQGPQGYQGNQGWQGNQGVQGADYTGFENRTSSTLGMNGGNFEITTGSSYNFWSGGTKYTKSTTQSVAISNNNTLHYVYFDTSGTLQVSTSAWSIPSTNVPVATVYRYGAGVGYAIGDERHYYDRNRRWHEWAHDSIGARYENGYTPLTINNTTFSLPQGVVLDEDIHNDSGGTKTSCRLWYRNTGAASMAFESAITTPYKPNAGVLQYDNAGTLTNLTNGYHVCSYIYGTNDPTYPVYVVVGQAQYNTVAQARNDTLPVLPALTTAEWKLLYRAIYQNVGGTATYVETADYRQVSTGPATSPATSGSHTTLTDRSAADQHPASSISTDTTNFNNNLSTADTTVQLALDTVDNFILSADTERITQATHGFVAGDTLYYTGSAYAKAKADATSTAEVVGVVQSSVDANTFIIVYNGRITGLSALTAGTVYYLSATTAGALTATDPIASGYISKPVLVATSTTSGVVINMRGISSSTVPYKDAVKKTVAGSLTPGQASLYTGSGALCTTAANAEAVGVVETSSGGSMTVVTHGFITLASGTWPESATAGDSLYLSSTAGTLSKTPPSTAGYVDKPIVVCTSTTSGYVINYRGMVIPLDAFDSVQPLAYYKPTSVTVGQTTFNMPWNYSTGNNRLRVYRNKVKQIVGTDFTETSNTVVTLTSAVTSTDEVFEFIREPNGATPIFREIEAHTEGVGSPHVLTDQDSEKVLTNEGSTAKNYHTLPTAVAGYTYTFYCQDSDGIRITAAAGDTIRIYNQVSAAAGYAESTAVGSVVTLVAINASEWVAVSMLGSWTVT